MSFYQATELDVEKFNRDGYLFVNDFLDEEETQLLLSAARGDHEMVASAIEVKDTQGRHSRLALWNHPPDDVFGAVARCHRVVDTMEKLLGGEVYHYHSKVMMKEPRVGGAWEWHQDYGYWYKNGCLFPYLASCMIALDAATKENGCLQVLRGSHHIGRIEHGIFGEQTGADPERVKAAMDVFELVHCEMRPGTALFFHGNTLHASAANNSDKPRWALICCYNAARNNPYKESHHPRYTPLVKAPDPEVKAVGLRECNAARSYMKKSEDQSIVR